MKTLPKALIIAAVIATIGYGATFVLPKPVKQTETVKIESESVSKIEPEAPTPPASASAKVVIPEVEHARNAGLDKLLNSGKK